MTRTLHLFLDAFSSRYMEEYQPPFLTELGRKGFYSHIEPMFAFQGIGAAIYTGHAPNSTKLFCDYVLRSSPHSPRFVKEIFAVADLLSNDRLVKNVRYVVSKTLGRHLATPDLVPPALLDSFGPKLEKPLYDPNPIKGVPTLFDSLGAHGVPWWQTNLRKHTSDFRAFKETCAAVGTKEYYVVCAKFSGLDSLGHKYGPASRQVRDYVMKIDHWIERIARTADTQGGWNFVIFSDHGMAPVEGTVDIEAALNKTELVMPDDYLVFLDSTLARFWFRSPRARSTIESVLADIPVGRLLTDDEKKELGIDRVGEDFGELYYVLDEGYIVFPNYFHRTFCPVGMHGYAYPEYDNAMLLLRTEQKLREPEAHLPRYVDILPTTLDLVGIDALEAGEGWSLVISD